MRPFARLTPAVEATLLAVASVWLQGCVAAKEHRLAAGTVLTSDKALGLTGRVEYEALARAGEDIVFGVFKLHCGSTSVDGGDGVLTQLGAGYSVPFPVFESYEKDFSVTLGPEIGFAHTWADGRTGFGWWLSARLAVNAHVLSGWSFVVGYDWLPVDLPSSSGTIRDAGGWVLLARYRWKERLPLH